MFDAAGMYPKGFHASVWNLDAAGRPAQPLHRRDVPHVKYYFTDFGLSTRFQEGEPRLVSGSHGLDRDVPELNSLEAYDPFPVDVFILGNVFKRNFTQVLGVSYLYMAISLTYNSEIREYELFDPSC